MTIKGEPSLWQQFKAWCMSPGGMSRENTKLCLWHFMLGIGVLMVLIFSKSIIGNSHIGEASAFLALLTCLVIRHPPLAALSMAAAFVTAFFVTAVTEKFVFEHDYGGFICLAASWLYGFFADFSLANERSG